MSQLKQENTESLIKLVSAVEGMDEMEPFLTAEASDSGHIDFQGDLPYIPTMPEGDGGQNGESGNGTGSENGGSDGGTGSQSGESGSGTGGQDGGSDSSGQQDGDGSNSGTAPNEGDSQDGTSGDDSKAGESDHSEKGDPAQQDDKEETIPGSEAGETDTGGGILEGLKEFPVRENLPAVIGVGAGLLLILVLILFARRELRRKRKERKKQDAADVQPAAESGGSTTEADAVVPAAGGCAVGKVHEIGRRKDQQDSFGLSDYTDPELCRRNGMLLVVADGMGGLSNGAAVSQMAVRTCMELFYTTAGYAPQRRLAELARGVNRRVNQMLAGQSGRSGSTLVTALIDQGRLYFLTVGDSRIYLYRAGGLLCLNRPHVYAEELMTDAVNGLRSMDAAETDGQKASLTSYVGAGRLKYVDRNAEGIRLLDGDRIMLSSDGVFGTLSEQQLEQALQLPPEQAAEQMRRMVEAAGRAAQDNYTAVILEYHSSGLI